MNVEEQVVIDYIRFEEASLKEIEAILDLARENGVVYTAEEFNWDDEIAKAETFCTEFAEKAPFFRERLENLVERWRKVKDKLI